MPRVTITFDVKNADLDRIIDVLRNKKEKAPPTLIIPPKPEKPPAIRKKTFDIDTLPGTTYIRQSQIIPDILPISPATLWRRVKNGTFPKPVKLSARVTAWRVSDIRKWMENIK